MLKTIIRISIIIISLVVGGIFQLEAAQQKKEIPVKMFSAALKHIPGLDKDVSKIIKKVKKEFKLYYTDEKNQKYQRVALDVIDEGEDGQVDYLFIYFLRKDTYKTEISRVILGDNYEFLFIEDNYELGEWETSAELDGTTYTGTCPDSSVEVLLSTCETGIPTAVAAINSSYDEALNAGYTARKLLGSEENKSDITDWLACPNLIYWGRVGHGYSGGIVLDDTNLTYTDFNNMDANALQGKVLYFNSCEVFNDPLKSSILNKGALKFIGGICNLFIGSSEEVFMCWNDHNFYQLIPPVSVSDEMCYWSTECESSTSYPQPGCHGCGGPGLIFPEPSTGPNYSITVISPNGGESWQSGTSHTINWTSQGLEGKHVDIELMRNSGGFVGPVAGSIPIENGSYTWTVGELLNSVTPTPDDSYYIRVETVDNQVFGVGGHFEITAAPTPTITVTSPGNGQNLTRGSTIPISWTKTGTMLDRVKIRLLKNGLWVQNITDDTENDGTFSWTIPSTIEPDSNYAIRVKTTDNNVYDDGSLFQISCPAQTYTIYATSVNNAWRWDWQVRAINAPDNLKAIQPYYNDYLQTDPLIALNFGAWTLPTGATITNVKVSARVAWEQPYHASYIMLGESTHNRLSGWLTYTGNTLNWVDMDITTSETSWTKAKVDALQVWVKRRWVDTPRSDFFVDAYRIVITTN